MCIVAKTSEKNLNAESCGGRIAQPTLRRHYPQTTREFELAGERRTEDQSVGQLQTETV